MSSIKKKKSESAAIPTNINKNIHPTVLTIPPCTNSVEKTIANPIKKKVQFESSIFLDQLFKKALKLAINQQANTKFQLEKNIK